MSKTNIKPNKMLSMKIFIYIELVPKFWTLSYLLHAFK